MKFLQRNMVGTIFFRRVDPRAVTISLVYGDTAVGSLISQSND